MLPAVWPGVCRIRISSPVPKVIVSPSCSWIPAGATRPATSFAGTSVYTGGYRLDETVAGGDVRYLHVLSLDGSTTSATASGDSTVTVNLAGGQTATVAFNPSDVGATLTYGGVTTTLGAGVDEIPE